MIPKRLGGLDSLNNLSAMCHKCHALTELRRPYVPMTLAYDPLEKLKIVFVAKLGAMGDDKMHVLVPKMHRDILRPLIGKQVRVVIDDEI